MNHSLSIRVSDWRKKKLAAFGKAWFSDWYVFAAKSVNESYISSNQNNVLETDMDISVHYITYTSWEIKLA